MASTDNHEDPLYAKPWSKVLPWIVLGTTIVLSILVFRFACGSLPTESERQSVAKVTLPDGSFIETDASAPELRLARALDGQHSGDELSYVLDRVSFDASTLRLTDTSHAQIDNIAQILKAFTDVNVQLIGHTAKEGQDLTDLRRSHQMATTVMNALIARGIERNRISILGYGHNSPLVPHDDARASNMNNRVELIVKPGR